MDKILGRQDSEGALVSYLRVTAPWSSARDRRSTAYAAAADRLDVEWADEAEVAERCFRWCG